MMRQGLVATAAAALVGISGAASAQNFSTDFGPCGPASGTFSSVTGGTIVPDPLLGSVDNVLSLNNPILGVGGNSASFAFTVTTPTPFYLLKFWYTAVDVPFPGSLGTATGSVSLSVHGKEIEGTAFSVQSLNPTRVPNPGLPNNGVPSGIGTMPGVDVGLGTEYSYFFGSPIVPGDYTLTIANTTPGGSLLNPRPALVIDSVSVTAVPEPSTYALMLAGLGVIGFAARRRRSAAASQPALAAA